MIVYDHYFWSSAKKWLQTKHGYITAMRMSEPLRERTWKKTAAERNKIKFACLGKSSSAETQNPICLACNGLSQLPRWVHGSNWIKLMAISSKVCRHIVYSLGTLLSLAHWHICALAAGFQKLSICDDAAFSFRRNVRALIKCSWSVLLVWNSYHFWEARGLSFKSAI